MNISSLDNGLLGNLDASSLKDLLRGKSENEIEGITQSAVSAIHTSPTPETAQLSLAIQKTGKTSSGHSNLMAGNFTGPTERSQYIEATKTSFQVKQQMVLRSHQVLAAAAAEMLEAAGIDRTRCGSDVGAAMEMRRISNKKTLEEFKKNQDEIQENIEQRAEEAMAPKDAEGNPVPDVTGTGSGSAPVADPAPTTAPETAPVESAGGGAVPEVATPEIASAVAISVPQVSIDITV